jgi:hypothetical protein
MFPGRGERELWERVLDRNISTVRALTQLGLPSCFAMVAFVIGQPSRAQIEVSRC